MYPTKDAFHGGALVPTKVSTAAINGTRTFPWNKNAREKLQLMSGQWDWRHTLALKN
jgi:hypothetical protein